MEGASKCLSVRNSADSFKMLQIHTADVEERVKGEAGSGEGFRRVGVFRSEVLSQSTARSQGVCRSSG